MNLIKIFSVIFIFFVFLFLSDITLAQSIGIGVSPAVLKYNFPSVYSQEFCFFNQGDTDAVYVIQSGDIKVLNEINFTVPANTNFNNCIKKTLQLVVDKSGYFYVAAYPKVSQNATVSIIRRVGIKVELSHIPTTTTVSQSSSGSSFIPQATTTTIINQTSNNTSNVSLVIGNKTSTSTSVNISNNETKNKTEVNISNIVKSEEKPSFDWVKVVIAVVVIAALIAFAFFLASELGLF